MTSVLTRSLWSAMVGGALLVLPNPAVAQHYTQTNLVSDIAGNNTANPLDTQLQNPWGLTRNSSMDWWISDNNNGLSTLYDGTGAKAGLTVVIPAAGGSTAPGSPTGIVANGTPDFGLTPPATPGAAATNPAFFIFATEDGTISGWNPAVQGTKAVVKVDNSKVGAGAVYKGLAFGQVDGAHFLYTANFRSGRVDVYDKNFQPVNFGPFAFQDEFIPPGFAPFNIQGIGPNLYVTYAQQDGPKHDPVPGAGAGFIDVFSRTGRLERRLEHGQWLNAPWGIVWTPRDFGHFSNTILVGQFGSGQIAAYNGVTGRFEGLVLDANNNAINIPFLWALTFGAGNASSGPSTSLYFTAGLNNQMDGLFGALTPAAAELAADDVQ